MGGYRVPPQLEVPKWRLKFLNSSFAKSLSSVSAAAMKNSEKQIRVRVSSSRLTTTPPRYPESKRPPLRHLIMDATSSRPTGATWVDRKDIHRVAQMDFVKNNIGRMAVTFQGHSDDRHGPGMKQAPEIPDSGPGFQGRGVWRWTGLFQCFSPEPIRLILGICLTIHIKTPPLSVRNGVSCIIIFALPFLMISGKIRTFSPTLF